MRFTATMDVLFCMGDGNGDLSLTGKVLLMLGARPPLLTTGLPMVGVASSAGVSGSVFTLPSMALVLALVTLPDPGVSGLATSALPVGERPVSESWSSEDKAITSVS